MRLWPRLHRHPSTKDPIRRTWFCKQSDGTYYRNCPLIMAEREEAVRRGQFDLAKELDQEWREVFGRGVTTATEISPEDRWIEDDDSPEAVERWVQQLLKSRGR
jgi:hypothetical protein